MPSALRDVTALVCAQGLAWLVRMYAEGFCSDYRFSYEHASPSVALLHTEALAQAAAPHWGAHGRAADRPPVGGVVGAFAVVGEAAAPSMGAPDARSHQAPMLDRAAVGGRAFGTAAGERSGGAASGPGSGGAKGPEESGADGRPGGAARGVAAGAAGGGQGAPGQGEYVDGLPRERAPLLPTACALALLPGGSGEAQVPNVRAHTVAYRHCFCEACVVWCIAYTETCSVRVARTAVCYGPGVVECISICRHLVYSARPAFAMHRCGFGHSEST